MEAGTIATFDPSTDSDSFRGALGSFVTGVTVVTTGATNKPASVATAAAINQINEKIRFTGIPI